MADTATYAGAMRTGYPDTGPYVARGKGDRRPGSLKGGMPIGVHRSAAQKRLGRKYKHAPTGSRLVRPKPTANGIRPV